MGLGNKVDLTSPGVDASLGYMWHAGFARLNYTYADVTIDNQPASSTAYYFRRLLGNGLRLGDTVVIALDNDDAAVPLDGDGVVNLYASYMRPAYETLEIRLDMRHLFDAT